jgi:hypothetical protein
MHIFDETESDLLFEVTNQYYLDFSRLVNQTLLKVPEHLRSNLEMMLQEQSSVFGRYDDLI